MLDKNDGWNLAIILFFTFMACLFLVLIKTALGKPAEVSVPSYQPMQNVKTYGDLCDALYWAEGGPKATYKYGIRSVSYDTTKEAREICLRTVKRTLNTRADTRCNGVKNSLQCLAIRYCPIGADNDKEGLNINWLRNVRYFLAHPKAVK